MVMVETTCQEMEELAVQDLKALAELKVKRNQESKEEGTETQARVKDKATLETKDSCKHLEMATKTEKLETAREEEHYLLEKEKHETREGKEVKLTQVDTLVVESEVGADFGLGTALDWVQTLRTEGNACKQKLGTRLC